MGCEESFDRVVATIEGHNTSVPPIVPPFQGTWAVTVSEMTLRESIDDFHRHARVQRRTAESCGFDGIEGMWDWLCMVEAMGGKVKLVEGMGPLTMEHPSEDPTETMTIPDPETDIRALANLRTIELLEDSPLFVYSTVPGAFTLASEIRGVEQLMMDMLLEPELCRKTVSECTDVISSYIELYSTVNPRTMVCESTGGPELLSPEDVRSVSLPAIAELVNKVEGHSLVHISGDTSQLIDDVADLGMDIFTADEAVDMVSLFDDLDCAILGGIPASILRSDKGRSSIQEHIEKTCQDVTDIRRFILGSTSDISPVTPLEAVECWQEHLRNIAVRNIM